MTAAPSIAPRRQLVARATALLFSVAAFSLAVVTWRSHGVVSGLLQDRISSDLAAHVIAIAGNVDAVITARLNDVQIAALNPAVVAAAAGDEKALPDARIALEALRQQDPAQLIGITLTDPIPQAGDLDRCADSAGARHHAGGCATTDHHPHRHHVGDQRDRLPHCRAGQCR